MKRFVFRLDAALKARQTILEARQADVLELTGRYDLATQLLAETEAKLAEHVKFTPKVGASFDPARELQISDTANRSARKLIGVVSWLGN